MLGRKKGELKNNSSSTSCIGMSLDLMAPWQWRLKQRTLRLPWSLWQQLGCSSEVQAITRWLLTLAHSSRAIVSGRTLRQQLSCSSEDQAILWWLLNSAQSSRGLCSGGLGKACYYQFRFTVSSPPKYV